MISKLKRTDSHNLQLSDLKFNLKHGMVMNYKSTRIYLVSSALLILAMSASAEESDKEYVARNMAAAVPACTTVLQKQHQLPANEAKSVCTCTYQRLFAETPTADLRRQEKAGNREATNKLVQPIMRSCYQAESQKNSALKASPADSQKALSNQSGSGMRMVDVNTANESEIASVISVGPEVAAQIMRERKKRKFDGWPDLVNRVVGLSGGAKNAYFASVSGLCVDGQSLPGAPPDAAMAASIMKMYQKH